MMDCVNRNFDLRREIWGDEALGGENGANLQMIRVKEGAKCEVDRTKVRNGCEVLWVGWRNRDRARILV